jgi:hypothetical protein
MHFLPEFSQPNIAAFIFFLFTLFHILSSLGKGLTSLILTGVWKEVIAEHEKRFNFLMYNVSAYVHFAKSFLLTYYLEAKHGFLKSRPPVCSALKVIFLGGKSTHISLRHEHYSHFKYPFSQVDGRLKMRAWALQAYLSRRKLMFLGNRIAGSCQTYIVDETIRDHCAHTI